jgi:hypothetical protein
MKLTKIAVTVNTILIMVLAALLIACGPKAGAGPEPEGPTGEEVEEEESLVDEESEVEEDFDEEVEEEEEEEEEEE